MTDTLEAAVRPVQRHIHTPRQKREAKAVQAHGYHEGTKPGVACHVGKRWEQNQRRHPLAK
jgi:hypothetical protein